MRCEIVSENLECVLTLPQKFQTCIEGLAGNFNGDPNDDLINRQTNQATSILTSSNVTLPINDTNILLACQSCKLI